MCMNEKVYKTNCSVLSLQTKRKPNAYMRYAIYPDRVCRFQVRKQIHASVFPTLPNIPATYNPLTELR